MSNQEQVQRESQKRHRRDEEPQVVPVEGGPDTGSIYREEADEMSRRFDEALATTNFDAPAAGPSAPLGQEQPQQVVRPGAAPPAQVVRSVSNETLVQGFRQTSGE